MSARETLTRPLSSNPLAISDTASKAFDKDLHSWVDRRHLKRAVVGYALFYGEYKGGYNMSDLSDWRLHTLLKHPLESTTFKPDGEHLIKFGKIYVNYIDLYFDTLGSHYLCPKRKKIFDPIDWEPLDKCDMCDIMDFAEGGAGVYQHYWALIGKMDHVKDICSKAVSSVYGVKKKEVVPILEPYIQNLVEEGKINSMTVVGRKEGKFVKEAIAYYREQTNDQSLLS